ncbi:glycerol kinase [Pitangus sulphuratus]|nr:glycerol kinase [Pitangus sulphuratus]
MVKRWTSSIDLSGVITGFTQVDCGEAEHRADALQSEGNSEVTEKSTRRVAVLDLVLINKEGLVEDVKFKDSLESSDDETVEFEILRAARREHSKLATLDFRRADLASAW